MVPILNFARHFYNMSKLEIVSLNITGFQDNNKRKRIFQTFRNSKFDIILLQETHSTDENVVLWKKDWTGCAFFSLLNSTKSRVAILCKESKNVKVGFENSDKAGRIISVTVETQKNKFQITNIYVKFSFTNSNATSHLNMKSYWVGTST